jgi:periplasmic divalent cation tolerance protein
MKKGYVVVIVTAGSEDEGARIGRQLVSEGLAACCNIVPSIRSIYTWKGKLSDEGEALCLFKTRRSLFEGLKKRVKELHSYEVPEVIAVGIEDGLEEYFNWIDEVTVT